MEYVPGIKINKILALDQLGVDRKRLVFLLLSSLVKSSYMLPSTLVLSILVIIKFSISKKNTLLSAEMIVIFYNVLQIGQICGWILFGTNSISWILPCWPCEFYCYFQFLAVLEMFAIWDSQYEKNVWESEHLFWAYYTFIWRYTKISSGAC